MGKNNPEMQLLIEKLDAMSLHSFLKVFLSFLKTLRFWDESYCTGDTTSAFQAANDIYGPFPEKHPF